VKWKDQAMVFIRGVSEFLVGDCRYLRPGEAFRDWVAAVAGNIHAPVVRVGKANLAPAMPTI
jgi:hypothetical protein